MATKRRWPPFALLLLAVLLLPLAKMVLAPHAHYYLRDLGLPAAAGSDNTAAESWRPACVRRWEKRANASFPGRDVMVRGNAILQSRFLKTSPAETISLGKKGWVFLDGPHPEMDYFRSWRPFGEGELAEWRRALLQRHLWLARQGIDFVYVIAPNKSTVYPEMVSRRIRGRRSRLDQLLDYIDRRWRPDGFQVLDLRKTLRAGKAHVPVYSKVDSHWNEFGAWLAADRILRLLARRHPFRPPAMDEMAIVPEPPTPPVGDLVEWLAAAGPFSDPGQVRVFPRKAQAVRTVQGRRWLDERLEIEVTASPGAPLPDLLMFRDSFGYALGKQLQGHFRKSTFLRDLHLQFHADTVSRVRPRIVIQEMAERFLWIVPPRNPPELAAIAVER